MPTPQLRGALATKAAAGGALPLHAAAGMGHVEIAKVLSTVSSAAAAMDDGEFAEE